MIGATYYPYLHVYVVWHPQLRGEKNVSQGQLLAKRIYSHLCHDVDNSPGCGLGIPVFFRSQPTPDEKAPTTIPLDEAQRTAVIVLVDPAMGLRTNGWEPFLADLWKQVSASAGRHLLLPVSLDPSALGLQPLQEANFIRYHTFNDATELQLMAILSRELCRFLSATPAADGQPLRAPTPVRLFISHATHDHLHLAEQFKDKLHLAEQFKDKLQNTTAGPFFDSVDLAADRSFTKEIIDGVRESVLLILISDDHSSRPYCRREVLEAKTRQRPVLGVYVSKAKDLRGFPYLGKAPVVRWTGTNYNDINHLAMSEALRFEYNARHLKSLQASSRIPAGAVVFPRAPELLDCVTLLPFVLDGQSKPKMVLYPDPPLDSAEVEILRGLLPEVTFATPSMLTREGSIAGIAKCMIAMSP